MLRWENEISEFKCISLGSYDVLIGMELLEGNWTLVNCKDKTISLLTEGDRQEIQGIKRDI